MAYSKEQKVAAYNWIVEYNRLYEMDAPTSVMSEMQVRLTNGCQQRRRAVNRWLKHEEGSREGQEWFAELKAAAEGLILVEACTVQGCYEVKKFTGDVRVIKDFSEFMETLGEDFEGEVGCRCTIEQANHLSSIHGLSLINPNAKRTEAEVDPSESVPVMRLPMFRAGFNMGAISDRPYECEADKQIDDEAEKAVFDFWASVGVKGRYWKYANNQKHWHWHAFATNSHKLVEDGELALAEYRIKCESNPQGWVHNSLTLRLNRYHHTLSAGFKLVTQKERNVWGHFVIDEWDGKLWQSARSAVEGIKDLKQALTEIREEEILKLKAKAWDDLHSNNGRTGPMTFDRQDLEFIWKGLALLSSSTKHGFNVGMAFEREFEELQIQIDCAMDNLDRQNEEASQ